MSLGKKPDPAPEAVVDLATKEVGSSGASQRESETTIARS